MPLSFFVDQCVPNSVGEALTNAGHVAAPLRDHLPTNAPDPIVIAKAQELGSILLTLNGDFADIVSYPPLRFRGIVALQLHNHPEITPAVIARLLDYLTAHPDSAHYEGRLFLVEPHRIRVRQ